jgi:large subunit ribosomal protein L25
MPEHIPVEVSALNVGDSIHVRDLSLTEGLEIKDSPDEVLAAVLQPTKEEPVAEAVGAEEGAAGEGEEEAGEAEGAKE